MSEQHERELVREFVEAKAEVDVTTCKNKAAKNRFAEASTAVLEHLESNSATATATYDGLGRVQSNKPILYASFLKENFEKVKAFLLKIKRDDLVKENINPKSLSVFVAACIEKGEEIPEEIEYYLKPQLRIY